MASPLVALILGVGPRIGSSVAEKFARDGYKVAVTSRKGTNSIDEKGYLSLQADLADPKSVPALFKAVQAEFHTAPSVIIYNAASLTPPPDQTSLLSIPAERIASDLNINTVSAYVAAQEAVAAWSTLPKETKKTFIYTGNILNLVMLPVPMFLSLGVGKAASSYWISQVDGAYADRGYRFFYADERAADGKNIGQVLSGPAHGEFFAQLAKHEGNVPWLATFVKEKGYVKF